MRRSEFAPLLVLSPEKHFVLSRGPHPAGCNPRLRASLSRSGGCATASKHLRLRKPACGPCGASGPFAPLRVLAACAARLRASCHAPAASRRPASLRRGLETEPRCGSSVSRPCAPVHLGCSARLRASAHILKRGRTVWMDGGGVRKTRFFRRPCINPAAPWENHSAECRVLRGL